MKRSGKTASKTRTETDEFSARGVQRRPTTAEDGSVVGHARCYFLRRGAPQARSWHMGIAGYGSVVGIGQFAASAGASYLGNDLRRLGCDPYRNPRCNASRARHWLEGSTIHRY